MKSAGKRISQEMQTPEGRRHFSFGLADFRFAIPAGSAIHGKKPNLLNPAKIIREAAQIEKSFQVWRPKCLRRARPATEQGWKRCQGSGIN
ncbi:MAG: hypothetical protein HYU36_08130 [Planctomycetes bacterium]|nr:hypothetical protein [Planctomycetota bacterium]